MTEIKKFTETDFEFQEVTRLFNLVSHDDKEHVDDMKEAVSYTHLTLPTTPYV